MSNYTEFHTDLTPEQVAKVPAGIHGMVDAHTVERALNTTPENRPRIYAYLERGESGGQIIRLKSLFDMERFEGLIGFAWTSETTIADMIGRA